MSPAPTISRLPKRNSAPPSTISTSLASSSRFNGSLANAATSDSNDHLQHEHYDFEYHQEGAFDHDDDDRSSFHHYRHPDTTHRINDSFNQPAIPFESDMPPILPLGEYATDDPSDYTSDDDGYTHSEYDDDDEDVDNRHEDDVEHEGDHPNTQQQQQQQQHQQQQRRSSLESRLSCSSKDNTASTSSTITNVTASAASASAKASTSGTAELHTTSSSLLPRVPTNAHSPTPTTTTPTRSLFASRLKAPLSRLRPPSQFSRTTPISSPLSHEIKHEDHDTDVTDQDEKEDYIGDRSEHQHEQDHLQAQESAEGGLHARYLETEPEWMQDGDEQDGEHLDLNDGDIGCLQYDSAVSRGEHLAGEKRQSMEEEMHGGPARLSTIAEVSELPSMTSITHHLSPSMPSSQDPLRYQHSTIGRSGGGTNGCVALGNRDLQLEDLMDEQDLIKEQERQERLANLKSTDILGPIYETQDFKLSSLTGPGSNWDDQMVPDYNQDDGAEDEEDGHEHPEGSHGDYYGGEESELDEEDAALKREFEELFGKGEKPPLAEIANSDIFLPEEEEFDEDDEDYDVDDQFEGDEDYDVDDPFEDGNSHEEEVYDILYPDNGTNRILETSPPAPVSTAKFPSRPPSTTPPSSTSAAAQHTPAPSLLPPTTTITPPTPSQSIGTPSSSTNPTSRFSGTQSLLRRNQEIIAAKQAAQQQRQQAAAAQQNKKPMGNILDGLWDESHDQDSPDEMSPGALHAARIAAELMRQEKEEEERRARMAKGDPPRSNLPPSGIRPPMTYAPLRPSPLSSTPIKATSRSSLATSEAGSSTDGSPKSRLPTSQPVSPHSSTPAATSRIASGVGASRLARPSSLYEVRTSPDTNRLARPTSMYDTRALTPPSPPQEEQQERMSPSSRRSPKKNDDHMHRFGSQSAITTTTATGVSASAHRTPTFSRQASLARKLELQRELQEIEAREAAEAAAEEEAAAMAGERDRFAPSYLRPSPQVRSSRAAMHTGAYEGDDGQDLIESREVSPRSSMDFRSTYQHQQKQQQQNQRCPTFASSVRTATTASAPASTMPSRSTSRLSPRSTLVAESGTGLGVDMNGGNIVQESRKSLSSSATSASNGPMGKLVTSTTTPALAGTRAKGTSTASSSREAPLSPGGLVAPLRRNATTSSMNTTTNTTTMYGASLSSSSPSLSSVSASTVNSRKSQLEYKGRIQRATPTLDETCMRLASIRNEIDRMRKEIQEMMTGPNQGSAPQSPKSSPSKHGARSTASTPHSQKSSHASSIGSGGHLADDDSDGEHQQKRGDLFFEPQEPAASTIRGREKRGGLKQQQQQQQQQQQPAVNKTLMRMANNKSSASESRTTRAHPSAKAAIGATSNSVHNPPSWDHYGAVVCFVNTQYP
ncbi:hypothetical protein BGW41_006612 [Actinomortierella wolfii]|nr:hypothetical protein BGW41_006612 [Actinomortierella wolfii]